MPYFKDDLLKSEISKIQNELKQFINKFDNEYDPIMSTKCKTILDVVNNMEQKISELENLSNIEKVSLNKSSTHNITKDKIINNEELLSMELEKLRKFHAAYKKIFKE